MKTLILGDVHGEWHSMNVAIARAFRDHPDITHIIQVGDLGYGWPGSKPFKLSRAFIEDDTIKYIQDNVSCMFLDGNHENHDLLDQDGGAWLPGWTYVPRGSVVELDNYRCLFMGGASSIDKDNRKPHVSWWPQESITYGQVQKALENDGPIHAVFSHEHFMSCPYSDSRYAGRPFGQSDKRLLEEIKQHFKPNFWFYGHHHFGATGNVDGTEWYCCPVIDGYQYTIWNGYSVLTYWDNKP